MNKKDLELLNKIVEAACRRKKNVRILADIKAAEEELEAMLDKNQFVLFQFYKTLVDIRLTGEALTLSEFIVKYLRKNNLLQDCKDNK